MSRSGIVHLLQLALNLLRMTTKGIDCFSASARFWSVNAVLSLGRKMNVVNTPTAGPNPRFQPTSQATPRPACLRRLCAILSYSYLLTPALAAAEPQLRVTGTLAIEASASQLPGATQVQARLVDDAGHPVPLAQLQIKPLNLNRVPTVHECQTRTQPLLANASGGYVLRSNAAGSVCAHFDGTPERAEFELSFSDPNGLYGAATRQVVADSAARNVEMAFAPAPTVISLERDTQIFSLLTRPMPALAPGEAVERLNVSLSMKRDGRPAQQLSQVSLEIGSSGEFRVPSRSLGAPGTIELSAEFPGSATTRAARSVAHATATALAELSLVEPVAASHPESGVRLRVRVSSVAGKVPSGSVEAQSGALSLGSARVEAGLAELNLRLAESAAKARPVELRYVPDSPWWLASSSLLVPIPIAPPSPWRRIAWIAAVALLGSWLLLGWQRPRRIERAAPALLRHSARAPVDVLEIGDLRSGWRGQVLDAHDGTPLANATILVRLPSFATTGVLRTAHSEVDGAFALEGIESVGPGAALEVRAPFHSPLVAPMPPPGTLILSLTSRRRTLLGRFVDWVTHDGGWDRYGEATPGEVARGTERSEVAHWARAVDEAAFGPDPLSETKEQGVLERQPEPNRKPRPKVVRS